VKTSGWRIVVKLAVNKEREVSKGGCGAGEISEQPHRINQSAVRLHNLRRKSRLHNLCRKSCAIIPTICSRKNPNSKREFWYPYKQ
jgi:hypothetical protein